jgi:[ribosomal protein S5]-alanine N-acetyltransferase
VAGVDHVLTTERLVLRPVTAQDHAVLLSHWTLPDVRRFLFDGEALSAAEVAETIEESVRDFNEDGYGIWLIQDGTGLVGTTGLRPLDELGLEIFYSLAPGSWGKGYATEAARAVVEHALVDLGLPEVMAEVDEGNAASVAVVKRLGMTPFGVVPGVLGAMTRYRKTAKTAEPPHLPMDHAIGTALRYRTDPLPHLADRANGIPSRTTAPTSDGVRPSAWPTATR